MNATNTDGNTGRNYQPRLCRLKEADDFKVAKDQPDIRGWKVTGGDHSTIGKVDELIVDLNAMKVRYLDIKIDDKVSMGGLHHHQKDSEWHILVPVGQAILDTKDKHIHVNNLNHSKLSSYPRYNSEYPTRDYEHAVCKFFDKDESIMYGGMSDIEFYGRDYFDEQRLYGQQSGSGNASVMKDLDFESGYPRNLSRLSEATEFRVAHDQPDIRGWEVSDSNGNMVGEVDELIVDLSARKVRYLDVKIYDKVNMGSQQLSNSEWHILVPVGQANLDNDQEEVRLHQMVVNQLEDYPRYVGSFPTRDYEHAVCKFFEQDTSGSYSDLSDADFYSKEYFNDQRFFGSGSINNTLSDQNYGSSRTEGNNKSDQQNRDMGKDEINKPGDKEDVDDFYNEYDRESKDLDKDYDPMDWNEGGVQKDIRRGGNELRSNVDVGNKGGGYGAGNTGGSYSGSSDTNKEGFDQPGDESTYNEVGAGRGSGATIRNMTDINDMMYTEQGAIGTDAASTDEIDRAGSGDWDNAGRTAGGPMGSTSGSAGSKNHDTRDKDKNKDEQASRS